MARHPHIGQRKQGGDLRRVLGQPFVAHLHKAKLALEHSKRMLHLGTNASLQFLSLVDHFTHGAPSSLECLALARSHGYMPSDVGVSAWALLNTLIPGIGPDGLLMTMQQPVRLRDVMRIATGATHRVHQAGVGIHPNVNTKGLPASW